MRLYVVVLVFVPVFLSCRQKADENVTTATKNSIIKVAERVIIERREGFSIVKIINPWQGAESVEFEYILVPRGASVPPGYKSSEVIYVPVKNIICMSATHLAMIAALGEEKSISGISGKDFVYNKKISDLIENAKIKDIGFEAGLNNELILKLDPDLMMMYGIGGESSGYVGKLTDSGIRVLYNADYLERDPLGKAEWIKLFGALFCREELAEKIFDNEMKKYDSLKTIIHSKIKERPSVLLGLPYKDTWYISPGNSYISKLISDAGGKYIWDDIFSLESIPGGFENVFLRALKADYWLNAGISESVSDIVSLDERLGSLPCINSVFNNNFRSIGERNDYWETGTLHPHLVLMDMASILHPELFPDHKLFFYHKL